MEEYLNQKQTTLLQLKEEWTSQSVQSHNMLERIDGQLLLVNELLPILKKENDASDKTIKKPRKSNNNSK